MLANTATPLQRQIEERLDRIELRALTNSQALAEVHTYMAAHGLSWPDVLDILRNREVAS
jgi:hypothetical protein